MIKITKSPATTPVLIGVRYNALKRGVLYNPVYNGQVRKDHRLIKIQSATLYMNDYDIYLADETTWAGNYTFVPSDEVITVTFSGAIE